MLKIQKKESMEKIKTNDLIQIFSWIGHNLKFILIPGSKNKELSEKIFEYEKHRSKRKFLKRLNAPLTILGIGIILTIITIAVFAPWISRYTFSELTTPITGAYDPPSPAHPLGQTFLGYDVLGRILFGARSSLTVALPAIILSVVFGIIFGVIAGYFRGIIDTIIMRLSDVFLAFPALILAIVLVTILGQQDTGTGGISVNATIVMSVYGLLGIPIYARLIRGVVLQARELPYVDAARVSGAGNFKIMFKHVLPNCIQPILVYFTFDIGGIILSLAGLSFLGIINPSFIEWGNDISNARTFFSFAPHAVIWPAVMIILTVLGFMLTGDGLRDALDPRLKNITKEK